MADNYLEKKMEELHNRKAGCAPTRVSPASRHLLTFPFKPLRVLVIARDRHAVSQYIKPFQNAGCRVAVISTIDAADTVVECFGQTLGKPRDREDARRMLSMLAGCGSAVHTGFAFIRLSDMAESCGCETTYVAFDEMSPEEIEAYISTDEPYDKAGAYGIQGRAALYIPGLTGDYFNVMGLPLHAVYAAARDSFGVLLTEFE